MHIQSSGVVQLYAEAKSQRARVSGWLAGRPLSLAVALAPSRLSRPVWIECAISCFLSFSLCPTCAAVFVARSALIENQNSGELDSGKDPEGKAEATPLAVLFSSPLLFLSRTRGLRRARVDRRRTCGLGRSCNCRDATWLAFYARPREVASENN